MSDNAGVKRLDSQQQAEIERLRYELRALRQDDGAVIADLQATVEELRAEIERLRAALRRQHWSEHVDPVAELRRVLQISQDALEEGAR